ncbi:hypothetical protein ACWGNZ_07110 [Sphingomonas zeae]
MQLFHLYSEGTFLGSARHSTKQDAAANAAAIVAASSRPHRLSGAMAEADMPRAMPQITDSLGRKAPF